MALINYLISPAGRVLISPAGTAGTVITTTTVVTSSAVIATTTIIPSSSSPVVTATAATIATLGLLVGFFYGHFLTPDGGIVQSLDCLTCLGIIRHVHESEAFALARLPIHNYFGGIYSTIQFKHLF